jgi:hypothetical protein
MDEKEGLEVRRTFGGELVNGRSAVRVCLSAQAHLRGDQKGGGSELDRHRSVSANLSANLPFEDGHADASSVWSHESHSSRPRTVIVGDGVAASP